MIENDSINKECHRCADEFIYSMFTTLNKLTYLHMLTSETRAKDFISDAENKTHYKIDKFHIILTNTFDNIEIENLKKPCCEHSVFDKEHEKCDCEEL